MTLTGDSPVRLAAPYGGASSLALRFTRGVVDLQVPAGTVGAYLLVEQDRRGVRPLYVGRSDTCLRRRLSRHPLQGRATHFVISPARDSRQAFALESYWYHQYSAQGGSLTNRIHPASPARTGHRCPFCPESAVVRAFHRTLGRFLICDIRSTS